MNKVMLMGRLTGDPVIRSTQDGKPVASFTLAVDRRYARNKGETTADFVRCVAWGKSAEFAEKYLRKGTKIVMSGRIQTGSYQDNSGKTIYTTDVVAEDMEFAESKKGNGQEPQPEDGFIPTPDVMDDADLPFN